MTNHILLFIKRSGLKVLYLLFFFNLFITLNSFAVDNGTDSKGIMRVGGEEIGYVNLLTGEKNIWGLMSPPSCDDKVVSTDFMTYNPDTREYSDDKPKIYHLLFCEKFVRLPPGKKVLPWPPLTPQERIDKKSFDNELEGDVKSTCNSIIELCEIFSYRKKDITKRKRFLTILRSNPKLINCNCGIYMYRSSMRNKTTFLSELLSKSLDSEDYDLARELVLLGANTLISVPPQNLRALEQIAKLVDNEKNDAKKRKLQELKELILMSENKLIGNTGVSIKGSGDIPPMIIEPRKEDGKEIINLDFKPFLKGMKPKGFNIPRDVFIEALTSQDSEKIFDIGKLNMFKMISTYKAGIFGLGEKKRTITIKSVGSDGLKIEIQFESGKIDKITYDAELKPSEEKKVHREGTKTTVSTLLDE